jgi:hypothetical protein
MEQQLDNSPNKYRDVYEEYIVKHNKFNFFKKPLKPYVPESSAFKYIVIAALLILLPNALKSSNVISMIAESLTSISYMSSIFFGVNSYFKFKEYNFSKGVTPLSQPITLAIVALMLAALPSLLSVGVETTFASGSINLNHPVLNQTSI